MLSSGLAIIYWLVQKYREAPFSVIVMVFIFLFSFASLVILFCYQKLKTKQTVGNQEHKSSENELTPQQSDKKTPKQLVNQEKVEPTPILLVEKCQVPVTILNSRNLLSIKDDGGNADAIVFALELRFKPTVDINGSLQIEAFIKIGNNPRNKGFWLSTRQQKTRLSAGHSDYLILAINRNSRFYQYKIKSEGAGMRKILLGDLSQLESNLTFEVEIVAKKVDKVVFARNAKLHLYHLIAECEGGVIEGNEGVFFGFTTDSQIQDGEYTI